ncbi:MAG: molecular chaperone DnaJ [Chloroflexi bacterium RBG_16_50_9]|nr:MAG: molecular chaperone DnaJ [Chloroflexi bacterium RBG_16_50_9]
MASKNFYDILGIKRNASDSEIKQAYRRLARKHHPEVNPGDKSAEARFKEINAAYEVLSDKEKRQKYDQFGDQWQYADQFAQAGRQQTPYRDFSPGGGTSYHFESSDSGDLGGIFEELFGGARARSAHRHTHPRRGQDIESPIDVTLEEAYSGTSRTISLQVEEPCSVCHGSGRIQNVRCSSCHSAGIVPRIKRLEVKIPAGVDNGSRVRIAGKGQPGYTGGTSGDLYLVISVRPHPAFERRGDNLHVDIPVPLTAAVLGGEVQVPTPKGRLALKIPPETQNGRIFRLAGQGMPHLGNSSTGDLLAKVSIVLPTRLSEKERELYKQLHEIRPV